MMKAATPSSVSHHIARQKVYARDDGVVCYVAVDQAAIDLVDAMLSRARDLLADLPRPRRCLIDLRDVHHRFTIEQLRCVARHLSASRPLIPDRIAIVINSRVIAVSARFALRPFVTGFSLHTVEAEAEAVLRGEGEVSDAGRA